MGGNARITVIYTLKICLGIEKNLHISTRSSLFPERDSIAGPYLHETGGAYPRLHWLFPSQFRCWNLLNVSLRHVFALDTARRICTCGCNFLTPRRYVHERNVWKLPHEVQKRQPSWYVWEDAGLLYNHAAAFRATVKQTPYNLLLCWYVDCQIQRKRSGV